MRSRRPSRCRIGRGPLISRRSSGKWTVVASADDGKLRKRHGLQGPIDDAFMDSFVMVRPTGPALNDEVGKWTNAEMKHAIEHWRLQFRGEARVKDDKDITQADIDAHNLILWGDPSSNAILAKIIDKLPLSWNKESVRIGEESYPAGHHVPVLIYPNPLNPRRYVVLNSGFTFREYDYLNNARQVPKLPDFAVVDRNVPVSSRSPGGIVTAGFFTEDWTVPAAKQTSAPTSCREVIGVLCSLLRFGLGFRSGLFSTGRSGLVRETVSVPGRPDCAGHRWRPARTISSPLPAFPGASESWPGKRSRWRRRRY